MFDASMKDFPRTDDKPHNVRVELPLVPSAERRAAAAGERPAAPDPTPRLAIIPVPQTNRNSLMALSVVIMAAGKGTRMRSARPKVLHRARRPAAAGTRAATAEALAPERCIVVTGHGAEAVEAAFAGAAARVRAPDAAARHRPRRAAGGARAARRRHHAGAQRRRAADPRRRRCARWSQACGGERLALLTVDLADPFGYGRIVRAAERRRDGIACRPSSRRRTRRPRSARSREVYTGILAAPTALLKRWLGAPDQRQRAGRVLPDRHRRARGGRRRRGRARPRPRTRPRCWASTARRSWPTSSAGCSAATPTR